KRLRKIRRAAGAARDWDVFLSNIPLELSKTEQNQAGLDFLRGYASAKRIATQADLERVADANTDFGSLIKRILTHIHRPKSVGKNWGGFIRPAVDTLFQEFEEAAAADLSKYKKLHEVRIAGKHLRYTLELCVDCLPTQFREEIYPSIEEMQDSLGLAVDSDV